MPWWVSATGSLAGVFTTIALLPQVIKTWRSRSASDVSLVMFAVYFAGILLWLIYGVTLGDWPLIGSNTVTLLLTGIMLILKLRYG